MVNPGLSRFKQPWAVPFVVAVLLSLFPVDSIADSIELDGTQFQDVYIRESATLYYICLPDDGRVLNIRKTDVEPESVKITEDFETRRAIFARWKAHHAKFAKIPEDRMRERIDLVTDSSGDEAGRSGPSESLFAGTPVPILRGKGVRRYNPELAARIQANLARMRGGSAPTGSIGSGSGTMSGGSGGSGGSGSGGGGGGSGSFSNISDLFSTIDDSEVGEFPPLIPQR